MVLYPRTVVVEQVCEICAEVNGHLTIDCPFIDQIDSVIIAPNVGELVPVINGVGSDADDPEGRDCWGCVTCGNPHCGWLPAQECDNHVHALSERHMNAATYSSIRRMARVHHRVMVAAQQQARADNAHLSLLDWVFGMPDPRAIAV